jgi:hypothetical protein
VPGLLFVATYAAWKFHVNQPPAPVLPPAGATIKGPTSFRFAVMGDARGTTGGIPIYIHGGAAEELEDP